MVTFIVMSSCRSAYRILGIPKSGEIEVGLPIPFTKGWIAVLFSTIMENLVSRRKRLSHISRHWNLFATLKERKEEQWIHLAS